MAPVDGSTDLSPPLSKDSEMAAFEAALLRLSPNVMQAFKATGKGWQSRIDAALEDWLKTHSPA